MRHSSDCIQREMVCKCRARLRKVYDTFCGFMRLVQLSGAFPAYFRHFLITKSALFWRKHWLRFFQTFWLVCGHNASISWEDIISCSKRGLVTPTFSFLLSTPLASQCLARVLDDFRMFEVELVYIWKLLLDSVKNRPSEGVLTAGLVPTLSQGTYR